MIRETALRQAGCHHRGPGPRRRVLSFPSPRLEMIGFLHEMLATDGFHPHGYCYLWKPGLIWLHVVSDLLIGLAYVAIGFGLAHFVRRSRGHLPFSGMFLAFGLFIAACGATHFVEIWTLWTPVYWFAGGVKVVTAAASVFTALALPPLIPVALNTMAAARVSEERRVDLELAHQRLTELDELKTQFFANVSHELRTPLALILGPVDRMLHESELNAEDRQRLETVRRNADLLLRHVTDLLDVAKLEAGRVELEYRRVDLARLVRRAGGHFESVASTRSLVFSVQAPDELEADADPDQLERVLFNLLGNALKFTPGGGEIRVELEVLDGEPGRVPEGARITVHDSGPGVPPSQRETIFEAFRQGDGGAARRHGGTGLGLAIVADLVELHGGSVRVEDSPLGGAAFVVELPLRAAPGVAVEHGPEDDQERPPATGWMAAPPLAEPAGAPPTTRAGDEELPLVLVVEDNPEMNDFITESLGDEYRVARAYDGAQGVEHAISLQPDLVVSDLMMPEVTGEMLVRELRTRTELAATPILLLSARADEQVRLRLLEEGAQDYLIKPFSPAELRARVRNWVEMKRARDLLRGALDSTHHDMEALAREITDRTRQLEEALESARLAFAEAEAASRAKSDFVSVMSHELRTPLNAIVGYLELLSMGVGGTLNETQQGYLERLTRSAEHLRQLVEDVLAFARTGAGADQAASEPLEMGEVVRGAASLLEPAAAEKGLTLEVHTPDAPLHTRSDPGRIRQVVLNLVGNAVKFTEEGQVDVALSRPGAELLLVVQDTGPGLEPEALARVFEPFWQADPTKTRTAGGTGLGLTITRQLVTLLGGEIEVMSEPGRGTRVEVRLPLVEEP
jgi:signal transduction histidine kinase